jgi:hypothetical protein
MTSTALRISSRRLVRALLLVLPLVAAAVAASALHAPSAQAYSTPTGESYRRIVSAFRAHAQAGTSYRIVHVHRSARVWVEVKVRSAEVGVGYAYMRRVDRRWRMRPRWNIDYADCSPGWRLIPDDVCRDFRRAR